MECLTRILPHPLPLPWWAKAIDGGMKFVGLSDFHGVPECRAGEDRCGDLAAPG